MKLPFKTRYLSYWLLILPALFVTTPSMADLQQTVRLDLYNILAGDVQDADWMYFCAGRARVDLRSTGNRMVRGRLLLDFGITDQPLAFMNISRASVRFRFPVGDNYVFRITSGKDRLTWGDGVFFNAGDMLFGASTESADFFDDILRDVTLWMLSGFFPIGPFSFFEAIILPPQIEEKNQFVGFSGTNVFSDKGSSLPGGSLSDSAAGFRLQFKPFNIKVEPGYLFRGSRNTHNPYLSLQGHLLTDWYISASTSIDAASIKTETITDESLEELLVSFGLLHIMKPGQNSSMSFRLEGLINPAGSWNAESYDPYDSDSAAPEYGILLFPEIIWSPNPTVSTFFRSVVSPVDLSAMFIPGVSWNIYQGFSMSAFVSVQAGEEQDLYSFSRSGALSLATVFSYIY